MLAGGSVGGGWSEGVAAAAAVGKLTAFASYLAILAAAASALWVDFGVDRMSGRPRRPEAADLDRVRGGLAAGGRFGGGWAVVVGHRGGWWVVVVVGVVVVVVVGECH
jgi:hypothetical protein